MTLHRMLYLRAGRLRGITFAAPSAEAASRLAERWAEAFGGELQTVKPLRGPEGGLRQGHLKLLPTEAP